MQKNLDLEAIQVSEREREKRQLGRKMLSRSRQRTRTGHRGGPAGARPATPPLARKPSRDRSVETPGRIASRSPHGSKAWGTSASSRSSSAGSRNHKDATSDPYLDVERGQLDAGDESVHDHEDGRMSDDSERSPAEKIKVLHESIDSYTVLLKAV